MKKQRIKGIVLVVVCFICVLCICSGFYRVQSKELSEIPDAVNSTRFNTTEHLTVVANQEEIADKEEPAKPRPAKIWAWGLHGKAKRCCWWMPTRRGRLP